MLSGASPIHHIIPHNLHGRDFVVGDLHGEISQLKAALGALGFNKSCDRLFSVGDLTDRGEDSFACLQLLDEPWFFAVRGNHDDMLLSALGRYDSSHHDEGTFLLPGNGGDWYLRAGASVQAEIDARYVEKLLSLPHVMTVLGTDERPAFHVVHSQLSTPGSEVDCDLSICTDRSLIEEGRDASEGTGAEHALRCWEASLTWSRTLVTEAMRSMRENDECTAFSCSPELIVATGRPIEEGLSPVFCGHTILPGISLHRSHFMIDRGGYQHGKREDRGLLVMPVDNALEVFREIL